MKAQGIAVLTVWLTAAACGDKPADRPLPEPRPAAPASAPTPSIETGPVAEPFRLVKTADSASVFVVKDGRKNAIQAWRWVEANAPAKAIETIPRAELDAFPYGSVTYR